MMFKSHVVAQVDKLAQFPEYTQLLQEASADVEQPVKKRKVAEPEKEVETTGSQRRRRKKAEAVKKFVKPAQSSGVRPSRHLKLQNIGLEVAAKYNMVDMQEVARIQQYLNDNGSWAIFSTPKDGQCLFSSVRRGLSTPDEYRSSHLRFQLVNFIVENHAFFYTQLKDLITFEYGGRRPTQEEYEVSIESGIPLSPLQLEAYNSPGPFSFQSYLMAMLDSSFWGDQGMIIAISMMWQLAITIVDTEYLSQIKIRHSRKLQDVDMVLVYAGRMHYVGACKYPFFISFF